MKTIQWGKSKDNFISLYKKSRKFKVIVSISRVFICYKRVRININNPLFDADNGG